MKAKKLAVIREQCETEMRKITQVAFGGGYENALVLVGDPAPKKAEPIPD